VRCVVRDVHAGAVIAEHCNESFPYAYLGGIASRLVEEASVRK
jgi:hypothetical protein